MGNAKLAQYRVCAISKYNLRLPAIAGRDAPFQKSKRLKAIYQAACTVGLQNQPLCNIADRRCARLCGPDGQKGLMLLRREAHFHCPSLTESQKPAQGTAKFRQQPVVGIGQGVFRHIAPDRSVDKYRIAI
jgi:hypothetical protein